MNFLAQYSEGNTPPVTRDAERKTHRWWLFGAAIIFGIVVVATIWVGIITRTIVGTAYRAYQGTMESISLLQQKNFTDAHTHAEKAIRDWIATSKELDRIQWVRWVPIIRSYWQAGEDMAESGTFFSRALNDGITLAEQLREPLGPLETSVDFMKLPRSDRRTVLGALVATPDRVREIRTNLLAGIDHFDRARDALPTFVIPERITLARAKLNVLQNALAQLEDLAVVLPDFAGYPTETTTLFIFQNNDELRPSGGFIGAYGLLYTDSGVITSLRTDDVYRLDNGTPKNALLPTPPQPIQRYLGVKKLYFRDANWSPDFPTTAQALIDAFRRESPNAPELRGVVSITPTVLERIMRFTGPVTIDGIQFTPENVTDVLEYEVEQGFAKRGIPLEDRKVIIGKITDELVQRLTHVPVTQTPEILDMIGRALEEKQMMIYHRDPSLQQQIIARGWSGQFPKIDETLFAIVDANLGSLKTDQVIDRALDVRVDFQQKRPRATITVRYTNRGQFTWKTTRYQTYVRLYTPKGSTLVRGDGFLDRARATIPGKIDTLDELGYTAFGGFTAIEPGEERIITYEIDLPEQSFASTPRTLNLLIPKQSGTIAIPLTVTLQFATPVRAAEPAEERMRWGDSMYQIQTDLRTDKKFSVSF